MEHFSAAVLGTICCDEIHQPGMKAQTGFGGIYYNLVTLAQLFDTRGAVIPVCKIGEDDYKAITAEFSLYPSIQTEQFLKYFGNNNRVLLQYFSQEERTEFSTHLPPPFTLQELLPIPDVKIYLINFISGREMSYNTFAALKKRLNVPLYVDLHSLFMGFKKETGERYYIKNRDWSRWHTSGDIVQMNLTEAQLLAGKPLSNNELIGRFSVYLLEKGAQTVLITKGAGGCCVCWKRGDKNYYKDIPAYHWGALQNPTGCGDVFSSAYVYAHLKGAEPSEGADFASQVAGVCAAQKASAELHNLKKALEEKRIII